jgi:NTP pyrophosphatase (non-canonical NTP hydrolase)
MLENYQKKVNELEDFIYSQQESGVDNGFVLFVHLISEVGEAADEMKRIEGKSVKAPDKNEFAKELVDIFINLMRICRYYDIDLDQYFEDRLMKIRQKFKQ